MKKYYLASLGLATMLLFSFGIINVAASSILSHNECEISFGDDDDRGDEIKQTEAEKYAEKKPEKRSAGKGISPKESVARQVARMDARANLAESLSAAITAAAKNTFGGINEYAGDDEDGRNMDQSIENTNTYLKSITNEVIQNTIEVKKNTFYNKRTRKYTVYVCLEYNGEVSEMIQETVTKLNKKVSPKKRKQIEQNMEKFEQEIEKELANKKVKSENAE